VVKRLLTIIIFFSFSQLAVAQNDCGESISLAQDAFDKGHIERIPSILHDCLNKFTTEQKVEAYRLLTITYLYLDDPFGAETSFLALLKEDPEYRILENDPVELEYLSKQYITTPIISYYAKVGANLSTVTILKSNSLDGDVSEPSKYNTGAGFNLLGALEVHFNKTVSLNFELELSSRNFIIERELFPTNVEFQTLEQNRFNLHGSLPVTLKFTYPGEIYYPYVYGGYSPSLTLFANGRYTRNPTRTEGREGTLNINNTSTFSHSLIFGAGVKRRFGYRYVLVDLRYRLGMTNMNNQQKQYDLSDREIKESLLLYGLPADDFRWNGFELTVGYVWPKYKPRAKNSVTLQTVVKKWFSKKDKVDE